VAQGRSGGRSARIEEGRHRQTTRRTMAWSATGASHDGRKPMTDDRTFDRDIVTADGSHRHETIETDDAAGAHETTEREHLSTHPGTGDEQVKGAVAGGVGGAVVGAIVGGPSELSSAVPSARRRVRRQA